jgi:hypothetical protein
MGHSCFRGLISMAAIALGATSTMAASNTDDEFLARCVCMAHVTALLRTQAPCIKSVRAIPLVSRPRLSTEQSLVPSLDCQGKHRHNTCSVGADRHLTLNFVCSRASLAQSKKRVKEFKFGRVNINPITLPGHKNLTNSQ